MKKLFAVLICVLVGAPVAFASSIHWRKTLTELTDNATYTTSPNHPETGDRGIVLGDNGTAFYYYDTAWHESPVGSDNKTVQSARLGGTGQDSTSWTGCYPKLMSGTWACDDNMSAMRNFLGLEIGTDVLAPNGSGASLTSVNASTIDVIGDGGSSSGNMLFITSSGTGKTLYYASGLTYNAFLDWTLGTFVTGASTDAMLALSGTSLLAGGTDTNVDINITPKGSGEVNLPKVDIDAGAIDGTAIGGTTPAAGAFTSLSASSTVSGTGITALFASPPAIGGTAPAAISGTTGTFSGAVTASQFDVTRTTDPQQVQLYEGTGDGNESVTITTAAMSGDATVTFTKSLAFTGTMTDGKLCTYTSSGNVIACNTSAEGSGDMLAANNLDDVDNATAARRNLGLEIGVDVPGIDPSLTNDTVVCVNSSENIGDCSNLTWDGNELDVNGGIQLGGSTGGSFVSNNGTFTLTGSGDGADETINIDLNTTSNTAIISSTTDVATVDFSALNLVSTGYIQGKIKIDSDADGEDNATMAAAGMYGTLFIATGAGTWILPTAVAGMYLCLTDSGTAHDLILDCQGTDTIALKGTEGSAGVGITNASGSTTGDFVCVVATAANKWSTMGMQGTWASQ